jgi:hypothetical protein
VKLVVDWQLEEQLIVEELDWVEHLNLKENFS